MFFPYELLDSFIFKEQTKNGTETLSSSISLRNLTKWSFVDDVTACASIFNRSTSFFSKLFSSTVAWPKH